ncbi:hypothetical protein CMI37_25095 [Candidatus Pacearchaeota archaeon]|nr:hypothetical protein [Candidatus Pacearchaeota archaeon]|tara:strand:- start:5367 stop:5675 length:309 start_codon:yes stop_codon:yes gene_type:complete
MKSVDARLYYALLDLSIPDLWDDVVGGYVSYQLTQPEQTYIIKKRIGLDNLDSFIDEAREFFEGNPVVYYKRSKWTASPIKEMNVEDALSSTGWLFSKTTIK